MRYSWGALNGPRFERLALDYAVHKYPQQSWRLLSASGDGNRDVESTLRHELPGDAIEMLAWIEAKFTRATTRSLSKGRLDPTLVSALIAPNVAFVMFISNGRFHDGYINRAERAFRVRHMLTRPHFIDGQILELWLDSAPRIAGKYFAKKGRARSAAPPKLCVRSGQIVAMDDYRAGHIEGRKNLRSGEEYVLQILVASDVPRTAAVQMHGDGLVLAHSSEFPERVNLSAGLTSVPLRFLAQGVLPRGQLVAKIIERPEGASAEHVLVYSIDPAPVSIRHANQLAIQQRLFDHLRRHQLVPSPGAVFLHGPPALGKTWILARVSTHVPLGVGVSRVSFEANSPAHNAQCICRGLLFMSVGSAYEFEGAAAAIEQHVRTDDVGKEVFRLLIEAHHSSVKASEALPILLRRGLLGPLFTSHSRGDTKVLIFDDVHKADKDAIDLLRRLLEDLAASQNKTLVIFASRVSPDAQFAAAAGAVLLDTIEMGALSRDDIEETLHEMLGPDRAALITEDVHRVVGTTLDFRHFAENVNRESAVLRQVGTPEFLRRTRELLREATARRMVAGLLDPSTQLAADMIFVGDNGVESNFVQKRFGREAVDRLLNTRLVIATAEERSRLRPKHDLLREAYLARRDVFSSELGDVIDAYLAWAPDRQSDLLGYLCRCGPSWQARYLADAIKMRDLEIAHTRYGAARAIAESLYHLAREGRDGALSATQRLEAIFAHADCAMHTRSTRFAVQIFEEVVSRAKKSAPTPAIRAITFAAQAEVLSQRFWLLDTKNLVAEIEAFLTELTTLPTRLAHDERVIEARFTALNRKMVVLFLHDRHAEAEAVFHSSAALARKLGDQANLGHLYMDKAKALCGEQPKAAVALMAEAQTIYAPLQREERRRRVCAAQLGFLNALLGLGHIGDVEIASEALLAGGFFPEYANSLLELAGLELVAGDVERASGLVAQLGRTMDAMENPRRLFLYHHLRSVLASLQGDHSQSRHWGEQHLMAVAPLGRSYAEIARHNLKAVGKRRASWAHQRRADDVWVDGRLW